jgi:GNAT superfamily N-acetyltransferase
MESDAAAGPFFEGLGYASARKSIVLQRRLVGKLVPPDPRFADLRRRFDIRFLPAASVASWWQDCVLGLVEPVEFRLEDKRSGQAAARLVVWEMEGFAHRWNQLGAGILEMFVRTDLRRQGIGRFLISQMLSLIQEQEFGIVEAHCPEQSDAIRGLLTGLGFETVDVATCYRKELVRADSTTA